MISSSWQYGEPFSVDGVREAYLVEAGTVLEREKSPRKGVWTIYASATEGESKLCTLVPCQRYRVVRPLVEQEAFTGPVEVELPVPAADEPLLRRWQDALRAWLDGARVRRACWSAGDWMEPFRDDSVSGGTWRGHDWVIEGAAPVEEPAPQDCPVCGGAPLCSTAGIRWHWVYCAHGCGLSGPMRSTPREAVEAWNRLRFEGAE